MRKIFICAGWLLLAGRLAAQRVELTMEDTSHTRISKFIYGQFAENLGRCIYDGFWTDSGTKGKGAGTGNIRMDVVNALEKIHIADLRWPGGCYADTYHWKDGIGPQENRPVRVNTTWGMVRDDNSFGTDEFLRLCSLLGCEPYIAGNVGTGTPQEMEDWLEYLNYGGASTWADLRRRNGHAAPYKVSLWGIGNESWGCGGQMTPEYYSDEFRRFSEFCRNYPGTSLKKIASGSNGEDYNWTDVCMKNIPAGDMFAISLHYYTVVNDWSHKGSATDFNEQEYFTGLKKCLHIEELVKRHSAIMDRYDPERKVALAVDEWGIWTDVEPGTNPAFLYQQNSLRDALIAASTLNIFNNHCERVRMANLAQTVNVLQALVLTSGDSMVLTPTYYVFDLYQHHEEATWIPLQFSSPSYRLGDDSIPAINASASRDSSGTVHMTLVNLDPRRKIAIGIPLPSQMTPVGGEIITSGKFNDVNTFRQPDRVRAMPFRGFEKTGSGMQVVMPPMSIVLISLK